jgi:hypothetical protein
MAAVDLTHPTELFQRFKVTLSVLDRGDQRGWSTPVSPFLFLSFNLLLFKMAYRML